MKQILNTWVSSTSKKVYYYVDEPLYTNGDWSVYSLGRSFIYAYKNVAVNELAGLNTDHVDRLAIGQRPDGEYNHHHFIFDRAMQNREVGLSLLKI